MTEAESRIDWKKKSIEKWGLQTQLDILVEECSELIQADKAESKKRIEGILERYRNSKIPSQVACSAAGNVHAGSKD